ncbi:thioredoxin-dependent thiol peroxidase [Brevibacillus centrosporus]|jgi:peroxiredoxin Q/BCP|uniref:thioredoxin-dependent peroxiredoxin n=1 Tax=Brevibacillus centrosporus TaxID=54910 RepID=A0A1I3QG79_9BACL|nr:thioredoxin-dependent thiol peroxidase [Brevibacillus centrosporus]MEC2129375.1 thioredoxin-dependent thiol peroxidase [Brevibacillus centrosporus]MED1950462.1 thioredoxin-dependent thiol peroxidase [Brevibacillus centrosporus]MED4908801.1 thioredoxin-dependent thiol peroxidase [Brevibacillus centrosporus]RNB65613.1 thioredoxin-dependent thiol peroxidase [Brevibacillus centrosporus]SFJ32367.1 peroxiredoxin Q/BCP [Brevibacillus centrosporus]
MTGIGQAAPDFTLEANENQTISLSSYRGKNVVLYFYPKDMTPGCTTEACDFRDYHPKFKQLDTVVLGISPDSVKSHDKFVAKHELPFPLLADPEHQVAEAYGVWVLKKMYGREYMGIERSTFVIDKQGNIAKAWTKVKVKGHVQEVLQFIEEELQA